MRKLSAHYWARKYVSFYICSTIIFYLSLQDISTDYNIFAGTNLKGIRPPISCWFSIIGITVWGNYQHIIEHANMFLFIFVLRLYSIWVCRIFPLIIISLLAPIWKGLDPLFRVDSALLELPYEEIFHRANCILIFFVCVISPLFFVFTIAASTGEMI